MEVLICISLIVLIWVIRQFYATKPLPIPLFPGLCNCARSSGLSSLLRGAYVLYLRQVKEENKKHHPDLVEFSKLPDQEKNLNLQAAQETLR